jgi:cytoskeletal protein CcmA (bactofilin family)
MDKGNKDIKTIIGEGTSFEGTITVPHSIRIDGSFKGKIDTNEFIIIGSSGYIEADILAKSAVVGGKVIGNMTVEDRVELESNSSLIGDLRTRDLIIHEGAVLHGNCSMEKDRGDSV